MKNKDFKEWLNEREQNERMNGMKECINICMEDKLIMKN